ncbi:carbamoyltransferase family protein [Mesorhizobium caraganae]|uniref:carbamoyltransferase family protein n=1 Tax=Mesorhizobium caraganae TaxID=483206 RepID=UPI003ECE8402
MAGTTILGISAYFHDSAAAVICDGEIVAAASEERFSREKGDSAFPSQSVAYCLKEAGIAATDLFAVGFYDKPILKFDRILSTYMSIAPGGFAQFRQSGPIWMSEKLWTESNIRRELGGYGGAMFFSEHHESHAASAFYPSPFQEAAILTIDGVGEWTTSSQALGRGAELEIVKEMRWPDSLGLLYSAFTYYTGFKVNSGEYKVMGLAPYGAPRFVQMIYDNLVDLKEDGSFSLNQEFFGYLGGLTMTNERFDRLFGAPPRVPESKLTQRDMDLARSVQDVCEEIMLRMVRSLHAETGQKNLCLAGGVALNCVGNGRILREGPFEQIWIQPASGDAGGSLGVAQLIWHRECGAPRRADGRKDSMKGAYLGPSFTDDQIEAYLNRITAIYTKPEHNDLLLDTARLLASGKVVGWFNGRMEFGPRALGSRSILGDPRSATMQAEMNTKIKFREGFRPFAPSVLRERVGDYFDLDQDSPYMLIVAPVKEERRMARTAESVDLWGIDQLNVVRSDIPAVTHIDYSARVHTVSRDVNKDYYDLISEFDRLTGCPVLVNTSFNVRGEPIVCSPKDAYTCFMRTNMDALVIGPFLLHKEDQESFIESEDWRWRYQLD